MTLRALQPPVAFPKRPPKLNCRDFTTQADKSEGQIMVTCMPAISIMLLQSGRLGILGLAAP